MEAIMRQLRQEHADIARLLQLLDRQVAVFASGERPDYDLLRKVIDYFLDYPDAVHHPREDLIYRVLKRRDSKLAKAIGDLEQEHEILAGTTRTLSEILREILAEELIDRAKVQELVAEFVRSYRQHMKREERDIFPAAERMLAAEDWAEIDASVGDREDPLFGRRVAEHFRALRNDIDALARIVEET